MNFYVGQEVVCIYDSFPNNGNINPPIKKGVTYIINAIKKGCCTIVIDIGLTTTCINSVCSKCGGRYPANNTSWLRGSRFAPLESIPASHEIAVKKLIEESQTILN